MAAFDKVKSGIPQMDEILDYIRMGDNVVWQVSDIDEFRFFTVPYVKQAIEDNRDIVYIRFAQHAPILTEPELLSHVEVVEFDPDTYFNCFIMIADDDVPTFKKLLEARIILVWNKLTAIRELFVRWIKGILKLGFWIIWNTFFKHVYFAAWNV